MLDTFKDKRIIEVGRNIMPLKPLLLNISSEEKSVYEEVFSKDEESNIHYDFKKTFILFSNSQVYRTLSIYGLVTQFDKSTKYSILDLSILLNVWYNENNDLKKSDLLRNDILIIHGKNSQVACERKAEALIELISTRKTFNKITWIFIEGSTSDEFEINYKGVTSEIKAVYNSTL